MSQCSFCPKNNLFWHNLIHKQISQYYKTIFRVCVRFVMNAYSIQKTLTRIELFENCESQSAPASKFQLAWKIKVCISSLCHWLSLLGVCLLRQMCLTTWMSFLFFIWLSDYLCPPEANVYGIDFTRFKLRDMDTGTVLFEVAKPETQAPGKFDLGLTLS